MSRSMALALAFTALVFSSCGQDVVINVDDLPTGNAIGSAGSGTFNYYEVVKKSTCPAEYDGTALPQETDTWTSTVAVEQTEGYFGMDLEPASGRSGYAIDGGIFWYGNYRIGGTYWWRDPGARSGIKFINLMDGRFVDGVNDMKGETKIRVMEETETDPLDCEITVAFTAERIL